jgi:hypothetical protein
MSPETAILCLMLILLLFLLCVLVTRRGALSPVEARNPPPLDDGAMRDLRALLKTPEVSRPYVYCCRGCGVHFNALENHDFGGCRARKVAGEDGGAA